MSKKHLFVGSIFMCCAFTNQVIIPEPDTISLREAIDKKMISVDATSLGGYSGECVQLDVVNTSGKKINVVIPSGGVFHPADEGMQDIFVVTDQVLALQKGQKLPFKVKGYCCQASDRSPSGGIGFSFEQSSNPALLELAKFMNGKTFSDGVSQEAVWCVSDGNSVSGIYNEEGSPTNDLRKEVCRITKQKDVWFSKRSNHTIAEDGFINSDPVSVEGMIEFRTEAPMDITALIKSGNGSNDYKLPGSMHVPRAGKFAYDFNLRVKGWEKGKYEVVINGGDKVLLVQEFEI